MIETPRLLLRPLGEDDAPALAGAVLESLPELLRWMGWAHPAYDLDDAEGWVAYGREMWSLGREFQLGMFADGGLVGCCGLDHVDWTRRCANLGYWLRTSATGRGLASEAAAAVAAWGFRMHNLVRIEIVVGPENGRSLRTAARIGALSEGLARNRILLRGEPMDGQVWSLVPPATPRGT